MVVQVELLLIQISLNCEIIENLSLQFRRFKTFNIKVLWLFCSEVGTILATLVASATMNI